MKFLLSTLIALGCVSANATKIIKADSAEAAKLMASRLMDVGDKYSGALAVGRLSVLSWQAELVGMQIIDLNSGTNGGSVYAQRNVKATLDISQDSNAGEMDDSNAWNRAGLFYDTKRGMRNDGGNQTAISKVISVIYDPLDVVAVTIGTVGCMGADLEVLDLTTPAPDLTDKVCYKVRPKYIIEHAL